MKPILITGATGLLGNNLVRVLLGSGRNVRVLVRAAADQRPLADLEVERVVGDVCDADSVANACRGAEAVIHAAAQVHIGRTGMAEQRRVNVEGARHVADAALREGIRLVHVSTCDAIGVGTAEQPANEDTVLQRASLPYVVTKREAEQEVRGAVSRGLDATIVNPGFMLGPWDWKPSSGRMLLEVARGRGVFAPRGMGSVCDVRDVAAGIIAALERGVAGRRYILAGRPLRWLDVWRRCADVAHVRRPLCRAGPTMLWVAGLGGDALAVLTGREPSVNSAAVQHAWRPRYYSSARAEQELAYRMRPLEETIRDAWEWFQRFGYA